MRWSLLSEADRPTVVSAQSTAAAMGGFSTWGDGRSQPPGSRNTTTSPRSSGMSRGVSWFTTMRALICSVSSKEDDVM